MKKFFSKKFEKIYMGNKFHMERYKQTAMSHETRQQRSQRLPFVPPDEYSAELIRALDEVLGDDDNWVSCKSTRLTIAINEIFTSDADRKKALFIIRPHRRTMRNRHYASKYRIDRKAAYPLNRQLADSVEQLKTVTAELTKSLAREAELTQLAENLTKELRDLKDAVCE